MAMGPFDTDEEEPVGTMVLHVWPIWEFHDLMHRHDCVCEPMPVWEGEIVTYYHHARDRS